MGMDGSIRSQCEWRGECCSSFELTLISPLLFLQFSFLQNTSSPAHIVTHIRVLLPLKVLAMVRLFLVGTLGELVTVTGGSATRPEMRQMCFQFLHALHAMQIRAISPIGFIVPPELSMS
jgi:uncharacterized paraquat-inducible protein A